MSMPYYTTRATYDDLVPQPKPVLATFVVDGIDHGRLARDASSHDRIRGHDFHDNRQQHASPRRRTQVACQRCRKRKIKCSGETPDGMPCSNCQTAGPTTECQYLRVNSSELQPKTSYYAQPFVPYGPLPVAPSTPLGSSVVSRFPPSVQSGMRAFPFSRSYSVSDLGDMSPGSTRAYCDLVCSEGNVPGTSPFMSTASDVGSFYASQRAWQSADGLNKTPNAMFCPDQEPSASFSQAAYSVTGSTTHLQALSTDPPSLLQTRSLIPAENTDRTLPSPGNPALNDTRNSDLMSVPVSHLSTETAGSKIAATVGPKTMVDAMNCNGNQSAVNPSQPTTTSSDLTMMGNYLTSSAPSSLPTSEPVDAGTTIESLDTASCLYNYNGNS